MKEFTKKTGIKVKLVTTTLDGYYQKLSAMINQGNSPDLALFTCECLDEDGNVVPDASEFVRFTTERPAKIIGTGSDHCDHNSVAMPERRMYMGKIRIAVKPDLEQKELILTAFSDNCGIARFRVNL